MMGGAPGQARTPAAPFAPHVRWVQVSTDLVIRWGHPVTLGKALRDARYDSASDPQSRILARRLLLTRVQARVSPWFSSGLGAKQHAMTQEPSVDQVANALLRYLHDHPDASDTLDGIARWWFPAQPVAYLRSTVLLALERLVEAGVVEKRTLSDGTAIFRRLSPR